MATTIARQLKYDHPSCHITWAISFKYKQAIENNPYIDQIWEVKYLPHEDVFSVVWERTKKEAEEKKSKGIYDEIIYSQIFPDNPHHFDGTTRSSILRAYHNPITVDMSLSLRLFKNEVENVQIFYTRYNLSKYSHIALCECAPSSDQSFLNPDLMLQIANNILMQREDVLFIVSTHIKLETNNSRIIDASELSFRENAELSKYCTILIGCSSGITWLLNTDWAKKIPTIQFLNKSNEPFKFASLEYDFKHYGFPTDHIIESTDRALENISKIINDGLDDFANARIKYNEELKPNIKMLRLHLLETFRFKKFVRSLSYSFIILKNFTERNQLGTIFYLTFPFLIVEAIIRRARKEFLQFRGR